MYKRQVNIPHHGHVDNIPADWAVEMSCTLGRDGAKPTPRITHFDEKVLGPVSYTHLDVYKRQVTVSSAGVAGVGGGATFAALIVLPAMGLPVTLVALLLSLIHIFRAKIYFCPSCRR